MTAHDAQRLRRTAYHEAGHAVAAILLEVKIKRVSIVPDPDGLTLGSVHHPRFGSNMHPDIDVGLKARDTMEKQIIICFAGALTEKRIKGRGNWIGARHHHQVAAALSTYINSDNSTLEKHLAWLWARTESMQRQPHFWAAVEAVAAALLERKELSGDEAHAIAQAAIKAWVDAELAKRPPVKVTYSSTRSAESHPDIDEVAVRAEG